MPLFEMTYPYPVVFGDVGEVQPGEVVEFDTAPSTTWWQPTATTASADPSTTLWQPVADDSAADAAPVTTDPAPAA